MNKRLNNRYAMLEAVNAYLSEHGNLFAENSGLTVSGSMLQQKINEINERENIRQNVLKGRKEARDDSRSSIISKALSVSSKLFSYAEDSGNSELKAQSDYRRSHLNKLRDAELSVILNTISVNATVNIEALSSYGLSQEKLNAFKSEISGFQNAVDNKKFSEAVKVSSGKTLSVLFDEANQILNRIDKLMEEYFKTNIQFFKGYKSARIIKDFGRRYKTEENNPEALKT